MTGRAARPRHDDVRSLGQPRPRRLPPDGRHRARRRHRPHRHRRHLRLRRVRGDRRRGDRRATRPGRARHQGRQRDERRSRRARAVPAVDPGLVRRKPAPPRRRPHRRVPDAPSRPGHATRGVARRLRRTGARRARSAPSGRRRSRPTQLDELQRLAADRGWVRPTSEQPPYSVLVRGIESEVLPTCRRHGIGVLVWAPLNGGWLTGKYQQDDVDPASRALREPDHFDHRDAAMRTTKRELVDRLAAVAADAGLTLTQLALGFALANPDVTAVLLGPRTPEQLTELLDPTPSAARRRRPRRDRRDRPARHHRQPRRRPLDIRGFQRTGGFPSRTGRTKPSGAAKTSDEVRSGRVRSGRGRTAGRGRGAGGCGGRRRR